MPYIFPFPFFMTPFPHQYGYRAGVSNDPPKELKMRRSPPQTWTMDEVISTLALFDLLPPSTPSASLMACSDGGSSRAFLLQVESRPRGVLRKLAGVLGVSMAEVVPGLDNLTDTAARPIGWIKKVPATPEAWDLVLVLQGDPKAEEIPR